MVHPEKSCDELMHPVLKILNDTKSHIKNNMQKDNCTTICTKNNIRQSKQQIPEVIFKDFFGVAYYRPTFQTKEWYPFQYCNPHQWIDVCD